MKSIRWLLKGLAEARRGDGAARPLGHTTDAGDPGPRGEEPRPGGQGDAGGIEKEFLYERN